MVVDDLIDHAITQAFSIMVLNYHCIATLYFQDAYTRAIWPKLYHHYDLACISDVEIRVYCGCFWHTDYLHNVKAYLNRFSSYTLSLIQVEAHRNGHNSFICIQSVSFTDQLSQLREAREISFTFLVDQNLKAVMIVDAGANARLSFVNPYHYLIT